MSTPSLRSGRARTRRTATALAAAAAVAVGIPALLGSAAPASGSPAAGDDPGASAPVDLASSTPPSITYRIPAIAVTKHGTVLAAYDRRHDSAADLPNHIDVMLRRSTDNGASWDAARAVVEYPAPAGCGDPSLLPDRDTGRVFLFCTYSAGKVGYATSQPGTADTTDPNTLHVQVRYSDDDGRTWSAATDLNPQAKNPSWHGYFASSGHGVQTGNGRLIQPIVVGDGADHAADIVSDDHGRTWRRGGLIGTDVNESKALELDNGTVVQNLRPDARGYRQIATSGDGGLDFGAAQENSQLPDPGVNADEIRVNADNERGPHRDWLLFSNAADQLARRNLTLRLSCDNGASWPVQKQLHSGPTGYSAMAMLPNGRIGVLAELGNTGYTETINFQSVGLDELGAACK